MCAYGSTREVEGRKIIIKEEEDGKKRVLWMLMSEDLGITKEQASENNKYLYHTLGSKVFLIPLLVRRVRD